MKRRDYLKGLVGLGLWGLNGSKLLSQTPLRSHRNLILIELAGGNDGLNTLVPREDPLYFKMRPTIGLPKENTLALNEKWGLNPALKPLYTLWEGGDLALIQGVGYPHPNRSHFRSIEIWETGSDASRYLNEGWLSQVQTLNSQNLYPDPKVCHGVVLGGGAGPLLSENLKIAYLENPRFFLNHSKQLKKDIKRDGNQALNHILKVHQETFSIGEKLKPFLETSLKNKPPKGTGKLGTQIARLNSLLKADLAIPFFKCHLPGFDTHTQQQNNQNRLLKELAEGMISLKTQLKSLGQWESTLIMTYSEFGRRVRENGNKGTDHGTASVQFIAGGRVKGGIYGQSPSLNHLEGGDLIFTTDFRSVYAKIQRDWLKSPLQKGGMAIPGGLDFLKG